MKATSHATICVSFTADQPASPELCIPNRVFDGEDTEVDTSLEDACSMHCLSNNETNTWSAAMQAFHFMQPLRGCNNPVHYVDK